MAVIANVIVEGRGDLNCLANPNLGLSIGDECLIEVERLREFGRVVYLINDPKNQQGKLQSRVIRKASESDKAQVKSNQKLAKEALDLFTSVIRKEKLRVRAVESVYSFDRQDLRLSYSCHGQKEDVSKLLESVQELFKSKVALVQIGVRDEAGIIGGMGPCGRELCCCSWMTRFHSVNVRMAKAQNIPTHPAGISGMCGRLKCCLRFEVDTYRELSQLLPREGSKVKWADGSGVVVGHDILKQELVIRPKKGRILRLPVSDLIYEDKSGCCKSGQGCCQKESPKSSQQLPEEKKEK